MSLDGKILKSAREAFEKRKAARQAELLRRTAEVYRKNPKVAELDEKIRGTVADVIGYALSRGSDPFKAVTELQNDNIELQRERIEEIQAAGFPANYLDDGYMCPKCLDTGMNGQNICSCLMEIYAEEQCRELSSMLNIGEDSFDTFSLEWYDEKPDPVSGISPRDSMDFVYETCVRYAERFGTSKMNLLLSGGTGLGKTFLSTCIAKAVSEKGFSVVYDTASAIVSKMEREKFDRDASGDDVSKDVERFYKCDLLIIDDLGTEMVTSFTVSAIYNVINTRLISGKQTVINTNMNIQTIKARYSPQIASRLEGEYKFLSFHGSDIRVRKTNR